MSEHDTTENVPQPSLTPESEPITTNDEPSAESLPNDDVLPAIGNEKSLPKVTDCSKEDADETMPAKRNDSPSESQVKEEAELPSDAEGPSTKNDEKSSVNAIESVKEAKEEIVKLDSESIKGSADIPTNETTPSIEASTKDDHTLSQKPPLEPVSTEVPKDPPKPTKEECTIPATSQSSDEYAEHVTYTDDGTAIYTDPKTQYKYKWCESKNDWVSFEDATNPTPNTDDNQKSNPYENEHYRWCTDTNQWIPKTIAPASSQTETEHYRWDAEKNEWILKNQVSLDKVTYGYEDGVRTYTDKDGAVFFWETEKKAWFPKIDDDFMARYQMSYGFIDNTSVAPAEDEVKKIEPQKVVEDETKVDIPVGGVKRKAPPEPPKWFELDQTQNTKVYVSNLPLDITMEEFGEIMSKYGMIMRDPQTQKQKLKLYTEEDGQIKGDGLCDYIKVESVDLALKLLDESLIRGNKIKVQRAKFQMRGEYNPTLKPKRKKKDKEKLLKMKEKLFDWRPEKMRGERSKHEKVVIIKNLFTPELFDKEMQLVIDYQNDLREECSKCGTVRKVVVYDRHAEGVAQINMADPDQADLVVQMMNGRFFGKRKLIAEIWDGKTKYKIAETDKEVQERIIKWDKYLEEKEEKEEKDKARLIDSAAKESDEKVTTENVVDSLVENDVESVLESVVESVASP